MEVVAPFEVKRVYYLYGTAPGAVRGRHAHKKLRQLAFCPIGSCVIDLDDGSRKLTVKLERDGLLIEPMVWHELRDFSPDCVAVVLASEPYDEADYIRDYDEFRRASALTNELRRRYPWP